MTTKNDLNDYFIPNKHNNMEIIAQQITSVLNKTFSGYIKAISEKYPNIPEEELNKIMTEILPGYKISSFFSKKKEKKCKLEECNELCVKASLYCQAHKGGVKRKKTDDEKKEAKKNKKETKKNKKEKEKKEEELKEIEDNEEEEVVEEESKEKEVVKEKEKEVIKEKEKEVVKEKEKEEELKDKKADKKRAPPKKKKTNTKVPRTAYGESDVEPECEL